MCFSLQDWGCLGECFNAVWKDKKICSILCFGITLQNFSQSSHRNWTNTSQTRMRDPHQTHRWIIFSWDQVKKKRTFFGPVANGNTENTPIEFRRCKRKFRNWRAREMNWWQLTAAHKRHRRKLQRRSRCGSLSFILIGRTVLFARGRGMLGLVGKTGRIQEFASLFHDVSL